MSQYPKWFHPVLLGSLLLLLCTGLLLAPTTLFIKADIDLAWRMPGAARVPLAMLHALGGFVLVALAGALWSIHMRTGWRSRMRRGSGGILVGLLVGLTLTAVITAYAGDESLGGAAALVHLALGTGGVLPFAWHAFQRRRAAARRMKVPAPLTE